MANTILSVIIPVYNKEKDIDECIGSVVNQTYNNLDIILVDDGSTDNSGIICDKWEKKDKRIRVIHQKNKGMIGARHVGLLQAKGDYSIFIDADDFINVSAYEDLMKIALSNDADLVTSGCYRYWSKDKMQKDICSRVDEGLYDTKEIIAEKIFPIMLWEKKNNVWAIDPSLCMKVVKKEFYLNQYRKIEKHNFSFGEDSAIIYPAILNMSRIYITHNCYYYHRQRQTNDAAAYIRDKEFPKNLFLFYQYMYDIFSKTVYASSLIHQLDMVYIKSAALLSLRYPVCSGQQEPQNVLVPKKRIYLFPFVNVPKGSRIVLYGAGKIGKQFYEQLMALRYFASVMWVDQDYKIKQNVENPKAAKPKDFDYIVIAIKDCVTSNLIKTQLVSSGWNSAKIILPDFKNCFITI